MIDWSRIRLVVFDVDGTLYRQWPVRLGVANRLLIACARDRSYLRLRILRQYRALREKIAEREPENFEQALLDATARATGARVATIAAVVEEWIEQRPLPLLRGARYAHVDRLFAALRARGIVIGVLSDYPAQTKLKALELDADFVVWAGQPDVRALKPHPRGLQHVLHLADVDPGHALMIGDRDDRDGEAGRRLGVQTLIRVRPRQSRPMTFTAYDAAPFDALWQNTPAGLTAL